MLELCKAEVLASGCHGRVDLMSESFVAVVFWKIEFCRSGQRKAQRDGWWRLTIEARMRTWQSIFVAVITMNVETTEPIHALKLAETVERHFASTGDKL